MIPVKTPNIQILIKFWGQSYAMDFKEEESGWGLRFNVTLTQEREQWARGQWMSVFFMG